MKKSEMKVNEIPGHTPELKNELALQISDLAPEAFLDGKLDFEKLKELLGEDVSEDRERFGLFWPGKKRALRVAQKSTTATLLPMRESSLNWDGTKNIFVEGDNLEVLKILQKHYHAKIRMIFIDPPYNTGRDFIYPDNYREGIDEYLEWTSQATESSKRKSTNSETDGRFHSNWLNMMYPRLKLARNLIREDGSIFISIDDMEVAHLRKIMDEIFGESNFVANIVWQSRTSISDDHEVSRNHNHILVYARNRSKLNFGGIPLDANDYKNPDADARGPWKLVPLDANKPGGDTHYEVINPKTGTGYFPPAGRSWAINSSQMQKLLEDGRILFGLNGNSAPKRKLFLNERLEKGDVKTPSSIMLDSGTTKDGTNEVEEIFGVKGIFDYPKPTKLIKRLLQFGLADDTEGIILDFFAGSGSTGHAVMEHNLEFNSKFNFLLVQLPEPIDESSIPGSLGFGNLADVSRRRIELVASKFSSVIGGELLDSGFRHFKLVNSNFVKWQAESSIEPDKLEQHILGLRQSSNDEASPDALLSEILLKQGYSLTEATGELILDNLSFVTVGENTVIAYLDESKSPTMDQLKNALNLKPVRFIILEDVFLGDDELKTNLVQECKSRNIELWTA
jgi:adenine-specific DNA-methyltransferase